MKNFRKPLFILAVFGLATAGLAQTSSQQRTQQLQKLEEDLNSPNANVRLAAMEAAMQSTSPAMRARAMAIGLTSSDPSIFQMALKYKICDTNPSSLAVKQIERSHSRFDPLKKGVITINLSKCDAATGRSTISHNVTQYSNIGTMNFSGKTLNIDFSYKTGNSENSPKILCTTRLKFSRGLLATGTMACSSDGYTYGPVAAEMDFE